MLVVVAEARLPALIDLAPVLTAAQRQSQIVAFVATPFDLRESARLFPVRILEIRTHHRVLYGDVHLDGLAIEPEGLLLAALQELKNLELRLRQWVFERGADPDMLWAGLVQSLPKLASILETALVSRGLGVPATRGELLRAAGQELGIEADRLERVAASRLRAGRPTDDAVREQLGELFELIADLLRALAGPAECGSNLPA
ncbi:MAG TPA: hypothetical protein VHR45_00190 [Thermoanaerobaculia bacterium]|nr:hypothetical protein [Thermoanaerobaculia bacterium]